MKIKKFYDDIDSMSHIKRFGRTVNSREHNLSDHTLRVVALAYEIERGRKKRKGASLSTVLEELVNTLMLALLHDYEEVFSSDIVHPIKHKYFKDYDNIQKQIYRDELNQDKYYYVNTYKEMSWSKVVKMADTIDTAIQGIKEAHRGYRDGITYLDNYLRLMSPGNSFRIMLDRDFDKDVRLLFYSVYLDALRLVRL